MTAPKGFVLVPVEPTEKMLDAFCGMEFTRLSRSKQEAERAAYRAMLAASPAAASAEGENDLVKRLQSYKSAHRDYGGDLVGYQKHSICDEAAARIAELETLLHSARAAIISWRSGEGDPRDWPIVKNIDDALASPPAGRE